MPALVGQLCVYVCVGGAAGNDFSSWSEGSVPLLPRMSMCQQTRLRLCAINPISKVGAVLGSQQDDGMDMDLQNFSKMFSRSKRPWCLQQWRRKTVQEHLQD